MPSDNVLRTVLHISSAGAGREQRWDTEIMSPPLFARGGPSTQLRSGASRVPQFITELMNIH